MSTPIDRVPKPLLTYVLVAACTAVFLLLQSRDQYWTVVGALWPLGEYFNAWQLFSYAFLHGGMSHLVFNMLGLYMFGGDIERALGTGRFAVLYFTSVLTAAIAPLVVNAMSDSQVPTVGASGGLFGLLLVYALMFPKRIIVLLIPPIPMPAWLFVTLYAAVELWMGVTGTMQGVAHFAHLGGLVGAGIVWTIWRIEFQRRRRR